MTAQNKSYDPPVSIPIYISGNFGEIRPDHFHSGIDIKTQGTIGHKIFSIDEGYVSRIKIQANGYGNAIYICHPDGHTSVYGHLESFNQRIDSFVKVSQYRQKSFQVDLYPEKGILPVTKSEIIGFSGNSGSSSGPHLHFELRKSHNQVPVNPLRSGLNLIDKSPPKILSLYVYPSPQDKPSFNEPTEYKTLIDKGIYRLDPLQSIKIAGNGRFGLEVYDYIDGSSNSCGIYILEMSVAGKVIYLFKADEFSFEDSKYVNAHTDYRMEILNKRTIHLLFRKPNNFLPMYPVMLNDGIFTFEAGKKYPVRIRALDAKGNESILDFEVEGLPVSKLIDQDISGSDIIFRWDTGNHFEDSNIRIEIPPRSLYEDAIFEYARTDSRRNAYPYIHFIGNPAIPMHLSVKLSIFAKNIPDSLRSKTIIMKINGDDDDESGVSGTWNGDWISTRISSFGKYTLDIDTLRPKILPLNIKPGKDMSDETAIRYEVTDNLSGISGFRGLIDNEWVLFEYDQKNDLIYYKFDKSRLKNGRAHTLKFSATDGVGNRSATEINFFW